MFEGMWKGFWGFLSKNWYWILLAGLVILGALIFFSVGVFKSAKDWLSRHFGNPSSDTNITGGDTFHTNQLDATLQTLSGGAHTQNPDERTRLQEFQGLFQGAEGDRSLSDITNSPLGFLKFMITGNSDDLKG